MVPISAIAIGIGPAQSSARNVRWRDTLINHYRSGYHQFPCVFLRAYFNAMTHLRLVDPTVVAQHVVGEHIFPDDPHYTTLAHQLQIDVNSVQNGLLMLKHLEHGYGNGWLPQYDTPRGMVVQVLVAQQHQATAIRQGLNYEGAAVECIDNRTGQKRPMQVANDVFGNMVQLFERPSKRSLYVKAKMAFEGFPAEYVNPADIIDIFTHGCERMFILRKALGIPDTRP
eukprot:393238-Amphidinium_carterae.1